MLVIGGLEKRSQVCYVAYRQVSKTCLRVFKYGYYFAGVDLIIDRNQWEEVFCDCFLEDE